MPLPADVDRIVVSIEGAPPGEVTLMVAPLDGARRAHRGQVVHAGRPLLSGGAVHLDADGTATRFTIDLRRVDAEVDRLAVTAHRATRPISEIDGLALRIARLDDTLIASLSVAEASSGDEVAVVLLELYRKDGWRLASVGQGFRAGADALADHLGLDRSAVIVPLPTAAAATAAQPPPPPASPPPPVPAPPPPAPPPVATSPTPVATGTPFPPMALDVVDRQASLVDSAFMALQLAAQQEADERREYATDVAEANEGLNAVRQAARSFFNNATYGAKASRAPEPVSITPRGHSSIRVLASSATADTRRIGKLGAATFQKRRKAKANGAIVRSILRQFEADHQLWTSTRAAAHRDLMRRVADIRSRELALVDKAWGPLIDEINAAAPAWEDPRWARWQPAAVTPPAIRIGHLEVRQGNHSISAPAVAGVDRRGFVMWGNGPTSVGMVQDVMLQVLAQFPPGKARFVLVDPGGAGAAFAPFLHLSDFDERLIGTKVWTEPRDIEHQLSELQAHVELVIQRYLRGEYDTIEEHNRAAGEVAEAYRFLIIVGFPQAFTEQAAQRLVALARNGPRCGVIPVVVLDSAAPLPHGFDVGALTQLCRTWVLKGDGLVVRTNDGEGNRPVATVATDPSPTSTVVRRAVPTPVLTLSEPDGAANAFTTVMRGIGSRSKAATTVRVSMERLTELASTLVRGGRTEGLPTAWPLPTPGDPSTWWHGSADDNVSAIVGRVGAQSVQSLHLSGSDTAVHALIAGRTGSGKTNLLHATILALATTYSPDEVELFLLDFKEGVEFKPYADEGLPHARVVAIESEREFGLSVLQRLEGEIARRGAQFRQSGSTSLALHRAATGEPMPRQVLLIDEFHRLFPDEDKIAVECARILDLLVRQGRSFGIHVVLASQSLSGVAQVGRGTFSQIGVRVALQCEEADSRLIFSDENPDAARLERAGDAIMNTSNGRRDGNDPFQVVYMPQEQRQTIIETLRRRADAEGRDRRPVVFEGNAPALLTDCDPLLEVLDRTAAPPADPSVWVGAPISLDPAEPVRLRRRVGSHLLVVGSEDEQTGGTVIAAAVALAGQLGEGPDRRVTMLDFGALDDPVDLAFAAIDRATGPAVAAGRRSALLPTLAGLAAEVERRMDDSTRHPAQVLVVHRLHAARDLRPDDFGGDAPSAHELLATILREGPEVGIHVVATTDGTSALARRVDDRLHEEFGLVMCFRVPVDESLRLLDGDQAAHLRGAQAFVLDRDAVTIAKVRAFALAEAAQAEALLDRLSNPRSTA